MTEVRHLASWSLDENHIYLDDDLLDERLIDIHFMIDEKLSRKQKLELLREMIHHMEENL